MRCRRLTTWAMTRPLNISFNIILSPNSCFPSGLFRSGFEIKISDLSHACKLSHSLTLLRVLSLTIFRAAYRVLRSFLCTVKSLLFFQGRRLSFTPIQKNDIA
jgi:hypothetical protein